MLGRGRESFHARAWADAYAELSAADRLSPLEPPDLERLATAAHLAGHEERCAALWERAHHEYVRRGDPQGAARCGFWLALGLFLGGESARGGGWLARSRRLLDDADDDCVEHGFLLELQNFAEPDAQTAYQASALAAAIGERFGDRDLQAFARLGQGQALIRLGRLKAAGALLDEVMVSVTAGEVAPVIAGLVYCAVLELCQLTYDLPRAREWTAALTGWCATQPQLVPYRGQCLVHRSEIMQLNGAWPDAVEAARQAYDRLREAAGPAAGAACYQQGQLHRLRGEFAVADEAYRQASRHGREPQPGLALLRLAQGSVAVAVAAIRRALDEAGDPLARSALLPAYVEIMLAGDEVTAARAAAEELSIIAADLPAPLLRAAADQAMGAVLLAEGEARAALPAIRQAWKAWRDIGAPYETACAQVLLARACHDLGDGDSAAMEFDGARRVFGELGAGPDLARMEHLPGWAPTAGAHPTRRAAGAHGLTARECEVLAQVATGRSNRAIGAELSVSEHTVARHVQHVLRKLGVSSRAAAAAFAVEHGLVRGHGQD
jgi:DNA-binding CsgD family transcriptional regulator/tetratricopeptide (TPR) repeat protein